MNTADYIDKINSILSNQTKFKKLSKDSTEIIKKKINKLITAANAVLETHILKGTTHPAISTVILRSINAQKIHHYGPSCHK